MRTLCLLLILANVLYFTWSQMIDVYVPNLERNSAKPAEPPARIVLAREMIEANSGERSIGPINDVLPPAVEPLGAQAAPLTEPQTAQLDTLSCTSVGPFADLPQASQAQAALRAAGFEPRQRMEQGEIWAGYWVSVQGLATREAADSALKTLAANGIGDVYVMPGSDPPNVLSLGVFSDYQRAQRRVDEVRAIGLAPRIDDRKRAGSVYWIDVDLQEPGQLIDSSIFQSDPRKITRLEMRACPSSAAG
ncbi:MAG TPA: SPOR domain-containing protein [Steroidobacteraceae bacterium]|nr:SPOR domain-containing protein [Steroidobacteraceae bacterium]